VGSPVWCWVTRRLEGGKTCKFCISFFNGVCAQRRNLFCSDEDPGMRQLLCILAKAQEFETVRLRRGDKKVLKVFLWVLLL
jgi:hypothetical protein